MPNMLSVIGMVLKWSQVNAFRPQWDEVTVQHRVFILDGRDWNPFVAFKICRKVDVVDVCQRTFVVVEDSLGGCSV